jgi:hypothetical protein
LRAACQIAEAEPRFEKRNGQEPAAFIGPEVIKALFQGEKQ